VNTQAVAKALREMVAEGYARLALDATTPGVVIPPEYRTTPLCLVLEHQFSGFECDTTDIRVTLKFGGVAVRVVLPWTAMRTVTDKRDRMLFQFAPNLWAVFIDGAPQIPPSAEAMAKATSKSDTKARAARLGMRLVKGGAG